MDLKKTGEKSKVKALNPITPRYSGGDLCPLTPQVLQIQEFGFVLYPVYFMF